jgi:hypothetical protein
MDEPLNKTDVETRIRILEDRVGRMETLPLGKERSLHPAWAFLLGVSALALGYPGLGYPQHYYQFLFSGLLLLLLYHRGSLRMPNGRWRWPQVLLNFLLLCLLFKFLIGGGIAHPFDWLKLPALSKTTPPVNPSWYSVFVPDYTLQWQGIPTVSEWNIDITKIQTFLLLATFAGVLFKFEPFASITALSLLIISLPAYLQYNWDLVTLFLIFTGVSLYLQSKAEASRPNPS